MTTGDRILALLPATRAELLNQLQVSPATLHKWITRMQGELIHIGSWQRTRGDLAPVWHAGLGKDAKRPNPRTRAQVQGKYVQSLKDIGVYEDVLADQRRRNARRVAPKPPPDPLLAWIPVRHAA